jgi:hypothetical protein
MEGEKNEKGGVNVGGKGRAKGIRLIHVKTASILTF